MKKLFLIFALGANACLNAQGWMSNSNTNTIYSLNSSLNLSPIRIGIGVNNPLTTFDVNGGTATAGNLIVSNHYGNASGHTGFLFTNTNTSGASLISLTETNDASSTPFWIRRFGSTHANANLVEIWNASNGHLRFATNNLERARFTAGGNFGIGTTSPNNRVEITQGTAGNSGLRFTNLTSGTSTTTNNANQVLSVTSLGDVVLVNAPNNSGNMTNTCTINGYIPRLTDATNHTFGCSQIFDNGTHIGIGTTTISNTGGWNKVLDVLGANNAKILSRAVNATGTQEVVSGMYSHLNPNGTDCFGFPGATGVFGTETNHPLGFITNYTARMFLSATGNLGIGTNTPGGQLELSQDQGRKPSTNTWTITSDERLKNIHGSYLKGLNEILKLNPITYHYKNGNGREFSKEVLEQECIGFSAQEVKKIFPESVGVDDDGYLNLNIHAVLIAQVNAIKELNAKVEKQNNAVVENEELKAKIAVMEEKFALLEKTITQLCESGCEGLKKAGEGSGSDGDVLFQSIPNPTDSEALINYSLSREYANTFITLSSQDGRQLKSIKLDSKKGSGSIKLSLGELANGTYIYTLVAGERVIDSKKLQIVK